MVEKGETVFVHGPARSSKHLTHLAPAALIVLALAPAAARAAPPAVSITSRDDVPVGNVTTPTFSGLAQEVGGVVKVAIHEGPALGGAVVQEPSVLVFGPGEAWSVEASTPLAEGTYTAQARETNPAAETGYSAPVTFTVQTGAPGVTLLAPESPSANTTPSFTGTASDPLRPVTVQIHAGASAAGTVVAVASAIATGAVWHSSAASPPLAIGEYTAEATQQSSIGNPTGRSRPVTFAVVAPPPAPLAMVAPAPSPPVASFRWVPAAPKTGEEVLLVSNSVAASSPLAGFAWSLAEEGPFTPGASILGTTFSRPGPHTVRLRVTAADGLSSVVSETVPVRGRPATLMSPFPVVRLAGTETTAGVRLTLLKVQQAPAGARVTVRCRGRRCPAAAVRHTTLPGAHGVKPLVFAGFQRFLAAGTVLEITVAKPGMIGKYTRFTVRAGRLPERLDECLDAAGRRPLPCPS